MDEELLLSIIEAFNLGLVVRIVPEHNTVYVRLKYWRVIDKDMQCQTCAFLLVYCALTLDRQYQDQYGPRNMTLTVRVWPGGRELLTWDYFAEADNFERIMTANGPETTLSRAMRRLKLV